MNSKDYRNLQEAYLDVYEQEEVLDEISDRKVAAVGKRREKDVSKAFDNYADVSEKPGGTQKLATDISKLNRFKNLEKKRDRRINKESYDLYDLILSHLIDEGYADTQEAAERIMVNMSEGWRDSIVVEGYKEIDSAKHQRMYARYKNLRTAAMKDARETGEASGDNRFKMSKMSSVIDKSAENLRKKR